MLRSQAGQATTEYLMTITSVLLALGVLAFSGKQRCADLVRDHSSVEQCRAISGAFQQVLRMTLDDVVTVINMPF